jgi:hypothetical protein
MDFPHSHDEDDGDMHGPFAGMEAMRDWHRAYAEMQMEQRRTILHWGAVICSCRHWFDWTVRDGDPPQAGCSVHGVLAFNPLTGEMI